MERIWDSPTLFLEGIHWRYQRGNQNPTTQRKKGQNDKQRSTRHNKEN